MLQMAMRAMLLAAFLALPFAAVNGLAVATDRSQIESNFSFGSGAGLVILVGLQRG